VPEATTFSERKRAERVSERAERNLFAANATSVGNCPACGLMILGPESWTRAHGQLYHEACALYADGDGRALGRE
jgi:hypothetical protein